MLRRCLSLKTCCSVSGLSGRGTFRVSDVTTVMRGRRRGRRGCWPSFFPRHGTRRAREDEVVVAHLRDPEPQELTRAELEPGRVYALKVPAFRRQLVVELE